MMLSGYGSRLVYGQDPDDKWYVYCFGGRPEDGPGVWIKKYWVKIWWDLDELNDAGLKLSSSISSLTFNTIEKLMEVRDRVTGYCTGAVNTDEDFGWVMSQFCVQIDRLSRAVDSWFGNNDPPFPMLGRLGDRVAFCQRDLDLHHGENVEQALASISREITPHIIPTIPELSKLIASDALGQKPDGIWSPEPQSVSFVSELDGRIQEVLADVAPAPAPPPTWGDSVTLSNGPADLLSATTAKAPAASPATKKKRSTAPGEARAKIIAALTKHHQYMNGSCLNTEPVGVNDLARQAGVAKSSVSSFFNKEFNNSKKEGHTRYINRCQVLQHLVASLKLLNEEFSPHHLFSHNPPGEGGRNEDD
ncbi:MAG: hypothetical protein ABR915_07035 [Thermoguttaceae bacterium]|jgi:hypothetical protein